MQSRRLRAVGCGAKRRRDFLGSAHQTEDVHLAFAAAAPTAIVVAAVGEGLYKSTTRVPQLRTALQTQAARNNFRHSDVASSVSIKRIMLIAQIDRRRCSVHCHSTSRVMWISCSRPWSDEHGKRRRAGSGALKWKADTAVRLLSPCVVRRGCAHGQGKRRRACSGALKLKADTAVRLLSHEQQLVIDIIHCIMQS